VLLSGPLELEMLLPDGAGQVVARAVVARAVNAPDGSGDRVVASKLTGFSLRRRA
jgi:hypothetical protein